MIKFYFKYILVFFVFFTLLYLENFDVFGLPFAQLWKIPLLLFLIFHFFKHMKYDISLFEKMSLINALKMIFNTNIFYKPVSNFIETARFLPLPLLFNYFKFVKKEYLKIYIIIFAQYVLLSSVPYHLHILESAGGRISLRGFGFSGIFGHTGIFQNGHAASIIYSIAVLILIYFVFFQKNVNNKYFIFGKIYNFVLIIIGVYSIYLTFVRTGYFSFIFSLMILSFSQIKFDFQRIFIILALFFSLFISFYYAYQNVDYFRMRLTDQRINQKNTEIGSGRFSFWENSYNRWVEGDSVEILFGIGMDNLKEYQFQKIKLKIFSHNQFVDSLVQNGLLGFIIYVSMILSILYFIFTNNKNEICLPLSVFSAYLCVAFFQGGAYFFLDVSLAAILAYSDDALKSADQANVL